MFCKCYYCGDNFSSAKKFFYHFQLAHTSVLHKEYRCGQVACFRILSTYDSFRRHINKHFNEFTENNDTIPKNNQNLEPQLQDNCSNDINTFPETVSVPEVKLSNVDDFEKFLSNEIRIFISEMYSNSLIPRNFVQYVIDKIKTIFCNGIISQIRDAVSALSIKYLLPPQEMNQVEHLFVVAQNCFEQLQTEYKRMKYFENCGEYIPPDSFIIGHRQIFNYNSKTKLKQLDIVPVVGQIIPLRKVFKALFEKPEIFQETQKNVSNILRSKTYVNFIQGDLWKEISASYLLEHKTVFPLFLFFDDFQVGNALGPHANTNKLGAVYVTIPCLPTHLFSSLGNIFLFALFYSKDRKEFGNMAVFKDIISELSFLEKVGVKIICDGSETTVYFKLSLIIGDNLGMHSILGFTESFSATHCCRFCKISKRDLKTCANHKKLVNRTRESYDADVLVDNLSCTGIKERCVWNALPNYHITLNYAVDIMHDIFEGVCAYDITSLLNVLIFDYHLFSVDTLNNRIRSFNFGELEKSNVPPLINIEKSQIKIKMTASEMLCFSRYLGLMIGDFIPEGLHIWQIWIKLRNIIDIICAPNLQFCEIHLLESLVESYLYLIVEYFKHLKPKHHFMLHYAEVFKKSGPLINLWCMRSEQKHRESKLTANISGGYKNIILSLAKKSQIKLCHRLISSIKGFLNCGPCVTVTSGEYKQYENDLLASAHAVSETTYLEVTGILYKPGMTIVISAHNIYPQFGIIKKILLIDNTATITTAYFLCDTLQTVNFNEHFHAYEVQEILTCENKDFKLIMQRDLHDPMPCLNIKLRGIIYVSTRYIL